MHCDMLDGHTDSVSSMSLSHYGKYIVSGKYDTAVTISDIPSILATSKWFLSYADKSKVIIFFSGRKKGYSRIIRRDCL